MADTSNSPVSSDFSEDSPKDSYVKLAMRNMVRKGKTSLLHFSLTVMALMGLLVGLSIAFH